MLNYVNINDVITQIPARKLCGEAAAAVLQNLNIDLALSSHMTCMPPDITKVLDETAPNKAWKKCRENCTVFLLDFLPCGIRRPPCASA